MTVSSVAALLIAALLMAAPSALAPRPEPVVVPPIDGISLQPGRYVSGWLPYWKVDAALSSFEDNSDLFSDLTTFFHYASGPDGAIADRAQPGQTQAVLAAAADHGIPVLAAVLDTTAPGTMAAILADPSRRAAHIAGLLPLVDQDGYDGIDIDYEQFAFADGPSSWPQTRPGWVSFITELGAALDERGKYLTVAVPPQFDTANDSSSGYWVYDWPAIAPSIDALRVMTYDYSADTPGPIAPINWVERAMAFGLQAVGPQKLRLGVATYGRDWVVGKEGAGCANQRLSPYVNRSSEELLEIAEANSAEIVFDTTDKEAEFSYTQELPRCRVSRVVSFSDARSVGARAELALSNGTGIALWSLGGEDPDTWYALRQAALR